MLRYYALHELNDLMGDLSNTLNKMHVSQACIHNSSLFPDYPAGSVWFGRVYRIRDSAAEFHATYRWQIGLKCRQSILIS